MIRRKFLRNTPSVIAGSVVSPAIVPSTVFGQNAPSNNINIGQIGCGRIARDHDMPGVMQYDSARLVAVSDVDSRRMHEGKELVEKGTLSPQVLDDVARDYLPKELTLKGANDFWDRCIKAGRLIST